MEGWELGVTSSLFCGQIQALPGPDRGLSPGHFPRQPTREAAVPKLMLRAFSDDWAVYSESVCSSEVGSHPMPGQGKPSGREQPTAAGRSESIFIVGRELLWATKHMQIVQVLGTEPSCSRLGSPPEGPLLSSTHRMGRPQVISIILKVINLRSNLLMFLVAYFPPRNFRYWKYLNMGYTYSIISH